MGHRLISLGLIVSVVASPHAGLADRLATKLVEAESQQPTKQQLARADWSRVRKLAAGTEVIVTVNSSQPKQRLLLSVDADTVTLLNLTLPGLPPSIVSMLRKAASANPEYLAGAQQHGTVLGNMNVRVDRDGPFLGERTLAALDQIVERIARTAVAEIDVRSHSTAIAQSLRWGVGSGLVGGLVLGIANDPCPPACEDGNLATFNSVLLGAIVGAGIGLVCGFIRAARPEATGAVVYRAQ